eukprot:jgi/Bigna1/37449/e_gw1.20.69.1
MPDGTVEIVDPNQSVEVFERPHLEHGNILGYGSCSQGVLGNGSLLKQTNPCAIKPSFFSGQSVVKLSTFHTHCIALTSAGHVYTWGNGSTNALGHPKRGLKDLYRPTRVEFEHNEDLTFLDVAAGYDFSLFLDNDGKVWSCGKGSYGQLGNAKATVAAPAKAWEEFPELMQKDVVRLSAGYQHALAFTVDKKLLGWGQNSYGQLGFGKPTTSEKKPKEVKRPNTVITQIDSGYDHLLMLSTKGQVLSFGKNKSGALGNGSPTNPSNTPQIVGGVLNEVKAIWVAAGDTHSVVLGDDSSVYSWG